VSWLALLAAAAADSLSGGETDAPAAPNGGRSVALVWFSDKLAAAADELESSRVDALEWEAVGKELQANEGRGQEEELYAARSLGTLTVAPLDPDER